MRSIEFIAPVEAMRGNMSGDQKLLYAEDNNPAFDAPNGRQYARNYAPRYIGQKRAKDGRKYFLVKTKSATNLSARSRQAMALLGAAGAIYASIIRRQDLQPYTTLTALYNFNVSNYGYTGTFRKFVMDFLRNGLQNKVQNFTANIASIVVNFKNPWYDGTMTDGATVSNAVLVKFWLQLAPNAIEFLVGDARSQRGIAKTGMLFSAIANNQTPLNILGLQPYGQGTQPNPIGIRIGSSGMFLLDPSGENYVLPSDTIAANARYPLTEVAPTA